MQIPTFPKHPIDVPVSTDEWYDVDPLTHRAKLVTFDAYNRAVRQARDTGIVIGIWAGVILFSLGLVARELLFIFWPAACDGIDGSVACVSNIVGGWL
ncbi:hypothetical protein PANO111632_02785 [Paracoccus nototheniae]|uniref:Uncharacterized protein n=1 Tax=Paracoccus nototheniae TaxID=2489002 RepID=A0ABW4DXN1_9RHOB|nr:hypothetical protein [Paracoccus nototheniae]